MDDKPLTREQFEQIINLFLVELNHLCLNVVTDEELRSLPGLQSEIENYLEGLRDAESDARRVLYAAFAYVDEYVGADWDRVASVAYDAYRKVKP